MKSFIKFFIIMLSILLTGPEAVIYASPQKSAELLPKSPVIRSQQVMSSLSGKVVETMDSGGYTYINIEKDGKKTWVAVSKMKVTIGQDISLKPGIAMKNFRSKTLNRTFDTITFSGGAIGHHGTETFKKSADNKPTKDSFNKTIKVKKAAGPDAYTVAELYEKSAELNEKNIVLRGQVVKFTAQIMGKNWIHIQDGSGNSSNGNNDILVTSQDVFLEGDVVTLKGTLYKDKDFGSGYKYAVIVEEATIKK
jgi:hypothetical protein